MNPIHTVGNCQCGGFSEMSQTEQYVVYGMMAILIVFMFIVFRKMWLTFKND